MSVVPPNSDPRWMQIFKTGRQFEFELMAANLVFTRLKMEVKHSPNEQTYVRAGNELREVFAKNASNPKAQSDLKKIFSNAILG